MTGDRRTTATDADAWLALALVDGLPARKAFELAGTCGGPAAALAASPDALRGGGLRDDLHAKLRAAPAAARRERGEAARLGAAVVTWADAGYPARLRAIADPPLALFVRGALTADDELAVAIVGARRAGEYGRRVAGEIARGLAQVGITVVSGLATGIDAAAHRGALDGGGRTLAVMATGVDRVYPAWNRDLARDVVDRGALVTEFRAGTPSLQFHFPQRNRIIAGLTVGTVVVEAAERSGSLITAEFAVEQGREVFAVPGPIGTPHHAGSHRLIRQGATLVTRVEDVLDALAPSLRARLAAARAADEAASLSPVERQVLDHLGDEGAHVDEVVARAGIGAGDALETLLALELRRLVAQRPGMRFARTGAA
jgi:DNA processing protein